MILRLIKFNSWFAFACAVFCLLVAPLIVDHSLMSLGVKKIRIMQDETYLIAVTLIRVIGVLLFAYAMSLRLVVKYGFDPENLKQFFSLFAVGLIAWGGMLILLISVKSVMLAAISAFGLLEWLIIPVLLLFEYKKTDSWKAVPPEEASSEKPDDN